MWMNQEEIENMNKPITSTEIETVIKKLPTNKSGPDEFTGDSIKRLEKSSHLSFSNSSKKFQRKEHCQTQSMRPPSPLYRNQTKILQKKKITDQYH